jgi:hypothetical protein
MSFTFIYSLMLLNGSATGTAMTATTFTEGSYTATVTWSSAIAGLSGTSGFTTLNVLPVVVKSNPMNVRLTF